MTNKINVKAQNEDEYMNAARREYFTNMLEKRKAEILAEKNRSDNYLKDERCSTADISDRATLEEELSLELRTRERDDKLLNKINQALERLAHNRYGWCEQCGEEIGILRLEARPTAELCINCKEVAERRERGFSDVRLNSYNYRIGIK